MCEKRRALSFPSDYLCVGITACVVFVGLIGCTGVEIVRELSDSI